EDHVDSAEMLAEFLRMRGHETTIAFDAPAALALASSAPPTLAIIDIGLVSMDGFTLAARLRATFGPSFPIVALSAYTDAVFRKRASEVGIDTYLTKPVDLFAVDAALSRTFSR